MHISLCRILLHYLSVQRQHVVAQHLHVQEILACTSSTSCLYNLHLQVNALHLHLHDCDDFGSHQAKPALHLAVWCMYAAAWECLIAKFLAMRSSHWINTQNWWLSRLSGCQLIQNVKAQWVPVDPACQVLTVPVPVCHYELRLSAAGNAGYSLHQPSHKPSNEYAILQRAARLSPSQQSSHHATHLRTIWKPTGSVAHAHTVIEMLHQAINLPLRSHKAPNKTKAPC